MLCCFLHIKQNNDYKFDDDSNSGQNWSFLPNPKPTRCPNSKPPTMGPRFKELTSKHHHRTLMRQGPRAGPHSIVSSGICLFWGGEGRSPLTLRSRLLSAFPTRLTHILLDPHATAVEMEVVIFFPRWSEEIGRNVLFGERASREKWERNGIRWPWWVVKVVGVCLMGLEAVFWGRFKIHFLQGIREWGNWNLEWNNVVSYAVTYSIVT